jgi:hypothetical protein
MTTNTLVTHKSKRDLGIGCVAKVKSKTLQVNFGSNGFLNVKQSDLDLVDVSKCKTISFDRYNKEVLMSKPSLGYVIVGNEIKEFVGIGWMTIGIVTEEALVKYPRIVDPNEA